VIKATSVLLAVGTTMLLARSLGPSGYGTYAFVMALVTLAGFPVQTGLPTLVVRETARAQARGDAHEMRSLWRWTTGAGVGLGALGGVAFVAAVFAGAVDPGSPVGATVAWGVPLLAVLALGNLRGAALRGLDRVIAGQLPELIVRPAGFLAVATLCLLVAPASFAPPWAMAAHLAGAVLAFAAGILLLAGTAPPETAPGRPPAYRTRAWLASALPLALIAGLQLVSANTDIVMLGFFAPRDDVGVYRVAVQGSSLVAFGLYAVNMVASPRMARAHQEGDDESLQRLATHAARVALVAAVPAVAVLGAFGGPILGLVFGDDFRRGAAVLFVLALGQLVNAAFGSVGTLLKMTGHERDVAAGAGVAALVNVTLNLVLIPLLGMMGAALATVVTFLTWNGLLWRAVRRRLGIGSTALGWSDG
jgi:O-antigen/teichoic acid export membrane protein